MERERRARSWWKEAVARWRRSGLSAEEFAELEGVRAGTLRWWSWHLGRGTRAKHGSSAMVPIEIAVPETLERVTATATRLEVVIGESLVRCDVGTDVGYVAALVRALRER